MVGLDRGADLVLALLGWGGQNREKCHRPRSPPKSQNLRGTHFPVKCELRKTANNGKYCGIVLGYIIYIHDILGALGDRL